MPLSPVPLSPTIALISGDWMFKLLTTLMLLASDLVKPISWPAWKNGTPNAKATIKLTKFWITDSIFLFIKLL